MIMQQVVIVFTTTTNLKRCTHNKNAHSQVSLVSDFSSYLPLTNMKLLLIFGILALASAFRPTKFLKVKGIELF